MVINVIRRNEKPAGGAAVQAYGWIRGLLASGHEVIVLTDLSSNAELKEQCQDLQIIGLYNQKKGIRWLRWIYYRFPFLYKSIKKVNPDYLYLSVPGWTSFLFGLICKRLKIQMIQRISNDFMVDDRIIKNQSRIYAYFMHKGIHLADYILCQNDYQLQQITTKHSGSKVFKISNPIYQVDTSEPKNPDQRHYIAWLGLFQYQKNLKLLFEIARALPSIEFQVAGKEDPKCDFETLHYLARIAALPNVKMVGFLSRQQVFLFLSNAKYLLNTSHYEGFTNTFLEAMSAGTPIISSSNVNPDKIIPTFKLGFIYETVQELVDKIKTVSIR